jgi:hypothetical protein
MIIVIKKHLNSKLKINIKFEKIQSLLINCELAE